MDVTYGNQVVGTLDGTLEGGVRLGAGVQGKTIYLDGLLGSRVNYGVHTLAEGCSLTQNNVAKASPCLSGSS